MTLKELLYNKTYTVQEVKVWANNGYIIGTVKMLCLYVLDGFLSREVIRVSAENDVLVVEVSNGLEVDEKHGEE